MPAGSWSGRDAASDCLGNPRSTARSLTRSGIRGCARRRSWGGAGFRLSVFGCLATRFSRLVLAYKSVLLLRLLSAKYAKYGKLQWSFIGQKLDRGRQKSPGGDRGKSSMENLRVRLPDSRAA